jgi:hypothetical protein
VPGMDDRQKRHPWGEDGRVDPDSLAPKDEEEAVGPDGPSTDVIVRGLSVVPFLLLAALGLIGIVSWVLILLLGIGSGQPIWDSVKGLSVGQLLWQLLLAVLIGLLPLAVVLIASWAAARGFREDSGKLFWTVTQAVWGLMALALFYVQAVRHDLLDQYGFSSLDWWFGFGVVAFAMILAGVRLRRAPRSEMRGR